MWKLSQGPPSAGASNLASNTSDCVTRGWEAQRVSTTVEELLEGDFDGEEVSEKVPAAPIPLPPSQIIPMRSMEMFSAPETGLSDAQTALTAVESCQKVTMLVWKSLKGFPMLP